MRAALKEMVSWVFRQRVPATRVHRALAYQHIAARFAWYELQRIFYYQPLFEALCASVEPGLHLEMTPDSKLPVVYNVQLHIGRNVRLPARATFSGARNAEKPPIIVIGEDCIFGQRVILRAGTEIRLGRHVMISTNCLLGGDPGHPLDPIARRTLPAPREAHGAIVIEDDVWLCTNVTVVGNVRIGRGSVVAASSVVTKDVPPYTLVAGNPARPIRSLDPSAAARSQLNTVRPASAPPAMGELGPSAQGISLDELRGSLRRGFSELFLSGREQLEPAEEERFQALWNRVLGNLTKNGLAPSSEPVEKTPVAEGRPAPEG
jgi:acetyltransferase-like isoleucine patch superfamily enzyme